MGIGSITGTCQGKRWEVPLDMDFGNGLWKNREVKIVHGKKSFLPDELKVVELLNQFDHKVSKVLRKIVKKDVNLQGLRRIRDCFDEIYKKADELNNYAGGNLAFRDLFKIRFQKILIHANNYDIEDIQEKISGGLLPEIEKEKGDSNILLPEDIDNLRLIETETKEMLDWRPQESVAQENELPRLIESETQRQEAYQSFDRSNSTEPPRLVFTENFRQENQQRLSRSNTAGDQRPDHDTPDAHQARRIEEAERIFENLTNLTFQGDQGRKDK